MQNILVPFDGSDAAKHAVQHVAALAKAGNKVQAQVVTVQETPVYFEGIIDGTVMLQIQQSLHDNGRKIAAEAGRLLGEAGVPHQLHVHVGLVADTIVEECGRLGCEAIVMGTHGRGAFTGLVMGSVATRVVHLARVPVTLVK
jgi:nucleotide-binding universal stress UspA family protein